MKDEEIYKVPENTNFNMILMKKAEEKS